MITTPENVLMVDPSAEDGRILLPFPVAVFYWRSGNGAMKAAGGTHYFGGWNLDFEKSHDVVNDFGTVRDSELETHVGSEGGEYVVHATRSLVIAPIRTRKKWITGERPEIEVLALVGEKNESGGIDVWGEAVLLSKGWAVTYLENTIKEWGKYTQEARIKWAMMNSGKPMPSWYFWSFVGTFGEFKSNMVGKGKQSHVAKAELFKPPLVNEKQLELYYVGTDIYRRMADLYNQAEEWATDTDWLNNTYGNSDIPVTTETIAQKEQRSYTDQQVAADMGVLNPEPDIDSIFP